MISIFRMSLIAAAVVCLTGATRAAEPEIITKARARLAPDEVLDAVQSLHFVGTLVRPDPSDRSKEQVSAVEIFLRKPDRQRIIVTTDRLVEDTALDGYDAWDRIAEKSDPRKSKVTLLSTQQIRQMRADVWQNLAFFRGIERTGGSIEDHGAVTIDGVVCEKISFVHTSGVIYDRYFEQATGRLVFTGNDVNNIREQGEMITGGIRFPKKIVITRKLEDGQPLVQTLTFDKITVNEPLANDLFEIPSFGGK
jgi:hypothetical protein